MHRQVDRIRTKKGHPEMPLTERLVVHFSGNLRPPVVDRAEDHHDRRYTHHHVEVGDHDIRIRQRHVDRYVTQEQTGEATVDKRKYESDRKQHRHPQVNVALPQSQYPVVNFYRRRYSNDQRRCREEESEVRMHSRYVHMVRPDNERQTADRDECPDHHAIAEDILASMYAEQIRHDTECRQCHDVHFGMTEEPEQMLEQDRATTHKTRVNAH